MLQRTLGSWPVKSWRPVPFCRKRTVCWTSTSWAKHSSSKRTKTAAPLPWRLQTRPTRTHGGKGACTEHAATTVHKRRHAQRGCLIIYLIIYFIRKLREHKIYWRRATNRFVWFYRIARVVGITTIIIRYARAWRSPAIPTRFERRTCFGKYRFRSFVKRPEQAYLKYLNA